MLISSPALVVVTFPKQAGRSLIAAISCPLLLSRQQFPNTPFSFAAHRLSRVALSAERPSPAAHVRIVARARKEVIERESFISVVFVC